MSRVRAFVALEISDALRALATETQAALRAREWTQRARPRWVHPEKMHVTLRFLGDVDADLRAALCSFLAERLADLRASVVRSAGLLCFPSAAHASVLTLGLAVPPALLALAEDLDARAQELGSASEKRVFRPHLTLARLPRRTSVPLEAELGTSTEPFLLDRVSLFHSALEPSGAVYRAEASWQLRRQ